MYVCEQEGCCDGYDGYDYPADAQVAMDGGEEETPEEEGSSNEEPEKQEETK
jgi:hypothetical protein